jgi:hypothetical protein
MSRRDEINSILKQVGGWSSEDRVALAYQLLRDMRKKALGDPPRHTFGAILGIGRGDGPPPTDEQVEQWIDEHRMKKYG